MRKTRSSRPEGERWRSQRGGEPAPHLACRGPLSWLLEAVRPLLACPPPAGGRALVLAFSLSACAPTYDGPTHLVAPAPFRALLAERGEVGSETETPVASAFNAKVNTLVPEGTIVKAGAVIGQLGVETQRDDHEKVRLRLAQMRAQLPLTRLKSDFEVEERRVEARNAELELRIAKLRFGLLVDGRAGTQIVEAAETVGTLEAERAILAATLPEAEALRRKGYVSDDEVRRMRARQGQLGAQLQATRAKLAALEAGPRREEIALERLKVEQAASAREAARKRLRAERVEADLEKESAASDVARAAEREAYRAAQLRLGTLRAPAAGIVIYQEIWTGAGVEKLKAGDTVEEGSALVKIADPARQVVRAEVQEAAAARIALGMAVRCLFDAYPGLVLPGRVRHVAPVASAKLDGDLNRVQAIEVTVALAKPDARLRPGMSANLEFVLAERPGALAVPTEAIAKGPAGPRVWVVAGGRASERAVATGDANERETVITSGLAAGDRVALRPPGGAP